MKSLSRNDLLLTGLLVERSMHGYEIAEILARSDLGHWVKMGRTSVYYALGRLERDDLVTKHVERHGDKPERSVFSITDAGRSAFFRALVDTLRTPVEAMDEFDVAIYFANRLEPDTATSAIRERITMIVERIAETTEALSEEDEPLGTPARLVLEHRLTVLRAEASFLERMIELFAAEGFDHQLGLVSGSLADTMLHEVLRTLASAKRSGTLRVSIADRTVEFALHRGVLYGLAPDDELGEAGSLEAAFTSGNGEYDFLPADEMRRDVLNVGELEEAILVGCRAVTASTAFKHVLPDPQTLLDVSDRVGPTTPSVGLSDFEHTLLGAIDGVKSVNELSKRLRVDEAQVVRSAYALWAAGWVVRTGREKRDLVTAVTAYANRWAEAIELFAGSAAGSRTVESIESDLIQACPSRFPLGTGDLAMFDYPETRSELAVAACDFIECLLETAAGVLGQGFVRDVMNGYAAQLSQSQAEVLIKNQAAPDRVLASLEAQPTGYSRRRRS